MPESSSLEDSSKEGPSKVSVVVVSYNSPETLELCLSSLCRQPVLEVIVVDCSDSNPAGELRVRFPKVKFRHFDKMSVPRLRSEGMREATGEIVATTEAWMVPAPEWVAKLAESHQHHPSDPVIGGVVGFPPSGRKPSAFQWADYFYEYGRHAPAAEAGYTDELTGPNCSYKRWAMEECRDLIERGAWETFLYLRLQQRGYRLRRTVDAVVHYHGAPRVKQALQQRFHYGRWFAGERSRSIQWPERVLRAVLFPVIPLVLIRRLWRGVSRSSEMRGRVASAFPWLLVFYSTWALGEFCGYLFGSGSSEHRIF